ncbi:3-hydroxyacyl-CoA dehydrogenase PaaH [Sphingobium sp. YR768]|uniref:3-hydroxyacyl-CoA dehydrogenase PaaH n=1 Tax=Sphingobium sp. YR768 TaxID=1884365 RepID=UPI0008C7B198|nr:3-hydroxyacyl-CoA dehydrogenase PaaH [Sphingobium sp. YR768]SES12716.1 3-hydroxyacyl-CoA dehydrogenase [Sphingobium sp. YR768]
MSALTKDVLVAVIGAGAMGAGIAQVAAQAGHHVLLYDVGSGAAQKGREGIAIGLDRLVARDKIKAETRDAIISRIEVANSLDDLRDAGLVIEAIVERLDIKRSLFRDLEALVGEEAILATNTSSLSVTEIGQGLTKPGRLAGLHFFNPAPIMALVEVVAGLATDAHVIESLIATAQAWGKKPVRCKSTPGFIVNRVARPFYAEALRLLEEGAAPVETIDMVLREAGGFRMGPFELMDLIGHDVNFAVTASVFKAYFEDPRFRPSLIQQELVAAGWLGRKSGRGFYRYADGAKPPEPQFLAAGARVDHVLIEGDLGPAEALARRLSAAGVDITRQPGVGVLKIRSCTLAPSDGRTATQRVAQGEPADLVLFDLALDYKAVKTLSIARADQADASTLDHAAALFARGGIKVVQCDDTPALIVLRTIAMLANEAAETVLQGVATASDVDAAMRSGVNYPRGPLEWAQALGIERVLDVLDVLHQDTGDDRYRASQLLRRTVRRGDAHIDRKGGATTRNAQ